MSLSKKFKRSSNGNATAPLFKCLLPVLLQQLKLLAEENRKSTRGRKADEAKMEKFLEAYFEQLDSGGKLNYILKHNNLSRGSYYRYLALIQKDNLFKKFDEALRAPFNEPQLKIVDATHIRSLKGSEDTSYAYKEKGKRAVKLTIVTGVNRVIYDYALDAAHLNDFTSFKQMTFKNPKEKRNLVLADAGYNGKEFVETCRKNGYDVLAVPCKNKNGVKKRLNHTQRHLLKSHRKSIEAVFATLKGFGGLQIKRNRHIKYFRLQLSLAVLLNNVLQGIINEGMMRPLISLTPRRWPITLTRKKIVLRLERKTL